MLLEVDLIKGYACCMPWDIWTTSLVQLLPGKSLSSLWRIAVHFQLSQLLLDFQCCGLRNTALAIDFMVPILICLSLAQHDSDVQSHVETSSGET